MTADKNFPVVNRKAAHCIDAKRVGYLTPRAKMCLPYSGHYGGSHT